MRRGAAVFVLLATAAGARDSAGLLSTIITPNEGVPAVLLAGTTFDAVVTAQGDLSLRREAETVALEVEWLPLPGDRDLARCLVPENAAAGAYELVISGDGVADNLVRAVWVVESFPETYAIAHITDTHIGSTRHARASEDIFLDLVEHVNASDAAFVAITGDVTENGDAEQFQSFLEVLNRCTKPTFVCAGNHDRQALHYEHAFGPLDYWFTYGEDGYLVFDTKDFMVSAGLDGQDSLLQRFRRAIMPCRWRIGLTHRYEFDMGMRSQLTLFVDNPLDYLIYGHWHRANATNAEAMPWPGVRATVTPAAINGAMRMFRIGPAVEGAGIEAGPVMEIAGVGEEAAR